MNIKTFISITSAVLCIAGCSEAISEIEPDNGGKITVTTEVGGQTKAGYEGTVSLPEKFIMDINQGGDAEYDYSLLEMIRMNNGNTYNASVNLWWADSDHSNVEVKAITLPYGMTSIDSENPMEINVCQDQTSDENIKSSDLLGATSEEDITIEGNSINISFNHLLVKLHVIYGFGEKLSGSTASISGITLKNTCIAGGYSYADMDYDETVERKYGNIKMYHSQSENTVEAIFYPYVPAENPLLLINAVIDGEEKEFECPINLKNTSGFVGGKRYRMTVNISGYSANDVTATFVKDWDDDEGSIYDESAESVLWVGTSIPAGDGNNNYPRMVADELGFNLYNNARGASYVCFYNSTDDGSINITQPYDNPSDPSKSFSTKPHLGYSLSATIEEIEAKFNRNDFPEEVLPEWLLESFRNHSFERLIIPYINGEKATCTTIVFDHGYNDRGAIVRECDWHKLTDSEGNATERAPGYSWLMELADNSNNTSESYLQGCWWDDNNTSRKNSYFYALSYLIKRCLEVNPKIKIVIGNYFAWKTPVFSAEYNGNDNMCNLLCGANEALGGMWMRDVVNVYKYTGIRNMTINGVCDYNSFCPDGVHPHSDTTGESNRIIAGVYINELRGIVSSGK